MFRPELEGQQDPSHGSTSISTVLARHERTELGGGTGERTVTGGRRITVKDESRVRAWPRNEGECPIKTPFIRDGKGPQGLTPPVEHCRDTQEGAHRV